MWQLSFQCKHSSLKAQFYLLLIYTYCILCVDSFKGYTSSSCPALRQIDHSFIVLPYVILIRWSNCFCLFVFFVGSLLLLRRELLMMRLHFCLDYRFLEEANRLADNAKRDYRNKGVLGKQTRMVSKQIAPYFF